MTAWLNRMMAVEGRLPISKHTVQRLMRQLRAKTAHEGGQVPPGIRSSLHPVGVLVVVAVR
jgi:hypothetical protein